MIETDVREFKIEVESELRIDRHFRVVRGGSVTEWKTEFHEAGRPY